MLHNPYSNHYHRESNIGVPYNGQIPHGLVPGKQIFISGTVLPHTDRFRIDLIGPRGIAFHFNPRFSANCVVRNSEIGSWGPEERQGPFPFTKGGSFELIILVEQDKYRCAINGQHAFDYNHRISFNEVTNLGIQGDVQIHNIVYSDGASSRVHEVFSPALPFATPLVHGTRIGSLIQITGQVPHHSGRFEVNLQNGPSYQPNEIPLHFSVRYNDPNTPEPVVIRNNRSYGNWGSEERQGGNPFHKGSNFEMLILIETSEYKVAVNGKHFISFRHRGPVEEGNHLGIAGDVTINSVRIY